MKATIEPYWVGVRKDRVRNHDVFQHSEPTEKTHPNYDYVIGPFDRKSEAEKRAGTEKNLTGTFTDPFCNNGQGR